MGRPTCGWGSWSSCLGLHLIAETVYILHMSMEVTVDSEKRVDLAQFLRPGEVYRVEAPQPGQIILSRLQEKARPIQPSYEAALEAVRKSSVKFSASYDELRKLTREP